MRAVRAGGLLRGGLRGAVSSGDGPVSSGDDMGDHDQHFHGPSGPEGRTDLCRGGSPSVSFLYPRFWVDSSLGMEEREQ